MKFKIVLESNEEGGYTAYVPALPGCIGEGETLVEALKNVREAIELYTEPAEEDSTEETEEEDTIVRKLVR